MIPGIWAVETKAKKVERERTRKYIFLLLLFMIVTLDQPHSTLKIETEKVDWYRVYAQCTLHIKYEKNMFKQTCYK